MYRCIIVGRQIGSDGFPYDGYFAPQVFSRSPLGDLVLITSKGKVIGRQVCKTTERSVFGLTWQGSRWQWVPEI